MKKRTRFSVSFSLLGLLTLAGGCSQMNRVDFTKNDTGDPTILEGTWVSVCYPVELDGTSYSAMEKVIFSGNSANSVVRKYEALVDSESQCGGEGLADVQKTSGTFSISEEKFNLEGNDLIEVESNFTRSLSPNTETVGVTHSTRRYFHIQGDRMYVANHQEDDELKIESGHYWMRQ